MTPQLKIWNEDFRKWSKFLSRNKVNALKASLIFALKNNLIDKFVIGLDNKKQFEYLRKEFLNIQKNKTIINIFEF